MNPYRRILAFANPHKKYIFGSLFFNILYSVFQIASAGTILPVLGMLFGTIKNDKVSVEPVYSGNMSDYFSYLKDYAYYLVEVNAREHGALTVLAWLCVITAFAFFARNIFRYIGSLMLIYYRVGVAKDLRTSMYQKILTLPVSFFTEQRKGDMMSRMSNDVGDVEGSILGSLVELVNSPFMLISTLITLFYLSETSITTKRHCKTKWRKPTSLQLERQFLKRMRYPCLLLLFIQSLPSITYLGGFTIMV